MGIKQKIEGRKTFMELATPPPSWKIPLKIAILFFLYSPNLNILSNKSQVSRQVQVCEKPNEHH